MEDTGTQRTQAEHRDTSESKPIGTVSLQETDDVHKVIQEMHQPSQSHLEGGNIIHSVEKKTQSEAENTAKPSGDPNFEAKVKQLVELDFDEALARRALEQTEDIEEAVNLILIFQDNNATQPDKFTTKAPTKAQVRELAYKMVVA